MKTKIKTIRKYRGSNFHDRKAERIFERAAKLVEGMEVDPDEPIEGEVALSQQLRNTE